MHVYARRLRTPLDAVLVILNKDGGGVASSDDAVGPDRYLRFTVPADGEYTMHLQSHLGISGLLPAKQPAASSTNGVVGRSGRKTPMPPSTSEKTPAVIRSAFFILSDSLLSGIFFSVFCIHCHEKFFYFIKNEFTFFLIIQLLRYL